MPSQSPLEELFFAVLAKPDADQAAFLDAHCHDSALRAEVERMLVAHGQVADFMNPASPTRTAESAGKMETAEHRPEAASGVLIAGKFQLRERIGEGGMGSVWVADQIAPVKRKVAVKLIKAGMDSRQVLARFEAERQALALMDHPNIAKVLDGGLHDDRPYFVMELVKGQTITEYCDARRLTPNQRLELFIPVCQAIQHAHQKGIIHRDIKPSNVIIALYDDKPVPKVIDFGVAKATGGTLTEATFDTGFGTIVGTPQYMSPEQATLNNLDIDTRSDVYSLGILLYELLTGTPPFAKSDLEKKGIFEMLRVVREEEPPRPSTKLSTADALPTLSANRSTEPKKLTALLRNELDWIVMKSLEKDRSRRYESANGFAMDIHRFLVGEPVLAHPPGRAYRIRKFVRRNRTVVLAAAAVLISLTTALGVTAWWLRQSETNRKSLESARNLADVNAERYRNMNDFLLQDLLGLAGPFEQSDAELDADPDIRLRTLVDRAAAKIDTRFVSQPDAAADMRFTLATSYFGIGDYRKAADLLHRVIDHRSRVLGPDHADTLAARHHLALNLRENGEWDAALKLYEAVYEDRRRVLGDDHTDTMDTLNHIGIVHRRKQQLPRAIEIFQTVHRDRVRRYGERDAQTFQAVNNLAIAIQDNGRVREALALFEKNYAAARETLGPSNPHTLNALDSLAQCCFRANEYARSVTLYEQSVALHAAKFGPKHPSTLYSRGALASAHEYGGKVPEAVAIYQEVLRALRERHPLTHPEVLTCAHNLATAHMRLEQWEAADVLYAEFLPVVRSVHGPDDVRTQLATASMAVVQLKLNKLDEAVKHTRESLASLLRGKADYAVPRVLRSADLVAFAVWSRKDYATAEDLQRSVIAVVDRFAPNEWSQPAARARLGAIVFARKRYEEAEKLLLDGYAGMKLKKASIPPSEKRRLHDAVDWLIELYKATKKPEELKKWRSERIQYKETAPLPKKPK